MNLRLNIAHEWVVLAAGTTAALHIGKLPPAIKAIQADLGLTLVESAFLLSLVQLAGVLGGVLVGSLVSRAGLRLSVLRGLSLLVIATCLSALSDSGPALLLLRAIEGAGFLMVILSGPGLIRQLVDPAHLGLRLGWWGCYMGFGTGVGLLLGPLIIEWLGWQGWWWFLALVTLLCLLWVQRAIPASVDQPHHSDTGTEQRVSLLQQMKTTLSHGAPWLISLMFACYSGQWLAVIGFLPAIYQEAGIPESGVALLTASVALANAIGNILSGKLLSRGLAPFRIILSSFMVMALMTWLTFSGQFSGSVVVPYVAVLLFSAVGGLIPGVLFFLAVKLAPAPTLVPATTGWMLQFSALGQLVTPPILAAIAATVGGWQLTWMFTAALALLGAVTATQLKRWL